MANELGDSSDSKSKGFAKIRRRRTVPRDDLPKLSGCEYVVVPFREKSLTDYLSYYDRLRSYVQHEDGLINTRLTWSLTIHGFLFAIYGLLLGKISDIFVGLYKIPSTSFEVQVHTISGLFFFQLPICLLGILIGHQSYQAILAAHHALLHLRILAHQGALACVPQQERSCHDSARDDVAYLPKIVGGGTDGEAMVVGAREYYLNLPRWIRGIWIFLGFVSLNLGIAMIVRQNWFFSS